MFSKQAFNDTSKRRRLSRWAINNAWKLSGFTAFISFCGVFAALTWNIISRPIPFYFFPLLSDVTKFQPEASVLYVSLAVTAVLFTLTTFSGVLHWHALHKYFSVIERNDAMIAARQHAHQHDQEQLPHPHQHPHSHQHQQSHHHISENHLHHIHTHSNGGTLNNNASTNSINLQIPDDEVDVSEIVPVSPLPSVRRRLGQQHRSFMFSTRALILSLLIFIITVSTIQFPTLYQTLFRSVTTETLQSMLTNFVFYAFLIGLVIAKGFLIWYFLKLQTVPDYSETIQPSSSSVPGSNGILSSLAISDSSSNFDLLPLITSPITTATTQAQVHDPASTIPPSPYARQLNGTANTDDTVEDQEQLKQQQQPQSQRKGIYALVTGKLKSFAWWLVAFLRPICLTGQAVCFIKIFGLWLALDTFSISDIRLVKIALLATLAFVEYTAAFFFSFFMTILAIDMKSKAPPLDVLFQT